MTLQQLLATWVVHDLNHLAQTARVLGRQYTDAVGPWRAYLPMLGVASGLMPFRGSMNGDSLGIRR